MDKRLMKLVQQLEQRKRESEKRELAAQLVEKARLDAIAQMRHGRAAELTRYARGVFGWCEKFNRSAAPPRLIRLDHRDLPIFFAGYWLGEPTSKTDRQCCAGIYLVVPPECRSFYLRYRELFKSQSSFESNLLAEEADLIETLHPDFLKELYLHLTGPDPLSVLRTHLERDLR